MRNGHLNTSFAAILAVLVFPFSCVAQEKADHIWTGGTIITMNDDALRAEAVAEKDGKVLAVGSKADVMKLKGDATKGHRSARPHNAARLLRCAWPYVHRRVTGPFGQPSGAA